MWHLHGRTIAAMLMSLVLCTAGGVAAQEVRLPVNPPTWFVNANVAVPNPPGSSFTARSSAIVYAQAGRLGIRIPGTPTARR